MRARNQLLCVCPFSGNANLSRLTYLRERDAMASSGLSAGLGQFLFLELRNRYSEAVRDL